MCCLAFDPDSLDKFDIELQYACEELESRNVTSVYDTGAGMCTTTTEVAMYVDFNADGMYMWSDDGELFDRLADQVDNDDDLCCLDAVADENFAVMDLACDKDIAESDDYFTFDDTLTCTRRFDRDTSYFLKSESLASIQYTHHENCIEMVVDRALCCSAKLAGLPGEGLEDACED